MSDPAAYPPAAQEVPVCPRHPSTVAYVRCQRCGRPTCPECQRPAAVGIQCVDCVRAGAATIAPTRTVLGGRSTAGQASVTIGIIAICAVLWLLEQSSPRIYQELALSPSIGRHEPWRFLTSAFLHGPLIHIGFNMLALWMLGGYLEQLLGRMRFAALYLISALGGSVAYLLLNPVTSNTGVVGASGAVFGLFGALLVFNKSLGRSTQGIWVNLAINAALPLLYPNIAWQAHVGGFLTGALLAWVMTRAGRDTRAVVLGAAGVILATVALGVARYALG